MTNMSVITFFSVTLLASTALAIDPDKLVPLSGKQVNTSALIQKIESTLSEYVPHYGQLIHLKKIDNNCLGQVAKSFGETDASYPDRVYYNTTALVCNGNSGTQQWRLVQGRLEVGSKDIFPDIKGGDIPCLDCFHSEGTCDLKVRSCMAHDDDQLYYIRVHSTQIDLVHSQVYFAIHSKAHPKSCLTIYDNTKLSQKLFHLQECTGSDEQSFSLDLDLKNELNNVRAALK